MRPTTVLALGATFVLTLLPVSPPAVDAQTDGTTIISSGPLTATVTHDPFSLTVEQDGVTVLRTHPAEVDPADPAGRYGPLGFGMDLHVEAQTPVVAYGLFGEVPTHWFHATRVVEVDGDVLTVATDDPAGRTLAVSVRSTADGVIEVVAEPSDTTGVTATGASFTHTAEERYLGFGQRADGVDQTGNRVENWTEEGPYSPGFFSPVTNPVAGDRFQGPPPFPGSNYVMPWFVSSAGYGFLLDSTWLNVFEMVSEREDAWRVMTREPELRYRVYAGPGPSQILPRFTADIGVQPEPAEWFFGPWYQPTGSREFQDGLMTFWREQDVPSTVSQEYGHYLPCGRKLNRTPEERRELTDRYHHHGYKVTTYVNQFVCLEHPDGYGEEGDANGWFIKTAAGTTYPMVYAAYPDEIHGMVDFTNPGAVAFYQRIIAEAIDDGFDGWMEDFGEYVPPDARTSDGRTGLEVHNEYCDLYHAASHELTWERRGADFGQYVRCGYTGTARSSRIVWQGDSMSDWDKGFGLAASISQTQSIGLSGVGIWGSDIGGFFSLSQEEQVDAELLTRWIEFGTFTGVMRLQSEGYPRPDQQGERAQAWDDDVLPHWRTYSKLRTQLFPYVWNAAKHYRGTGIPITRHLSFDWPEDSEVYAAGAEYQYLFGPDLLVAPVIEEGATERTLYLPDGDWVHWWDAVDYDEATGAFTARAEQPVTAGGRYVTVDAPLGQIPVFARAGTCLELLPPETDTLADVGEVDGLVRLDDVTDQRRLLGLSADDCGEATPGGNSAGDADEPRPSATPLPTTGGGLALLALGTLLASLFASLRERR